MENKTLKPSYNRILDITPYKPGETSKYKNKKSIKLSSNENPFGCSEVVKAAINEALSNLHRYPDGSFVKLKNKLHEKFGFDPDRVIFGSGSDEIITLICMAFAAGDDSEVIYTEHGFLMYPIAAMSVGAKPVKAKETDLKTDIDEIINNINAKTKIIFIANPNNPTGSFITKEEIDGLVSEVPKDVIVVLDCAYQEYAEASDYYPDAAKIVDEAEYGNVVMLRTFSKAYGIPNLRLGWAYGSDYVIDILNRVRGPFNVNGLAQVAGVAALEDQEFIKKSVSHNNKWLTKMSDEFVGIGLKSYPSIANFILVDFNSQKKAEQIDEFLRKSGITGRMMHSYGLPSCIRFTIGLEEENNYLIEKLKEIL